MSNIKNKSESIKEHYGEETVQTTELTEQKDRLERIQSNGYNVVNCGSCGTVIIIELKDDLINCSNCNYESEHCDFPDFVY
tara:strand:- start:2054 stop:2296 length:243 start_codon:yes stop_codon:yes gene_type:complete